MNILVFDIETIPDLRLIRTLYDWQDLSDEDTYTAITSKFLVDKGTSFLPLHLHQIVAISLVMNQDDQVKVWSLGTHESGEADLIQRFYSGIERFTPTLVSWNGTGFDLPVLHYRALKHGIVAAQYWDAGDIRSEFKYNNYVNRYHQRHTDVMDILALFQGRATVKLDQMAVMLGFPGKMGMAGDKVYEAYAQGNLAGIRDYCETDVLNTYLVYLRFLHMKGQISPDGLAQAEQVLQDMLFHESQQDRPHLGLFLDNWLGQPDSI